MERKQSRKNRRRRFCNEHTGKDIVCGKTKEKQKNNACFTRNNVFLNRNKRKNSKKNGVKSSKSVIKSSKVCFLQKK